MRGRVEVLEGRRQERVLLVVVGLGEGGGIGGIRKVVGGKRLQARWRGLGRYDVWMRRRCVVGRRGSAGAYRGSGRGPLMLLATLTICSRACPHLIPAVAGLPLMLGQGRLGERWRGRRVVDSNGRRLGAEDWCRHELMAGVEVGGDVLMGGRVGRYDVRLLIGAIGGYGQGDWVGGG